jgi:hypothetical protein
MKKASITLFTIVVIGTALFILSEPNEVSNGVEAEGSGSNIAEGDSDTALVEDESPPPVEGERGVEPGTLQAINEETPRPRRDTVLNSRAQRGILSTETTTNLSSTSTERPTADNRRDQQEALTQRRRLISSEFGHLVPALQECYEMLLELEPGVEERIVISLEITTDIQDADKANISLLSIESEQLEITDLSCFAEAIEELEMPPPLVTERQYRVRYPVILNQAVETDEE